MRVTFDEALPNTSILVESGSSSILLDCGFTAASTFWEVANNSLDLDVVYISHSYGDHYFGVPALLVRSVEEGRAMARMDGVAGLNAFLPKSGDTLDL